MIEPYFTEPTTGYWQQIFEQVPDGFSCEPPYRFGYPVRLSHDRFLVLPLRPLPDGEYAFASFIANQASHAVVAALAEMMVGHVAAFGADMVVGLPTLGLVFAPLVAALSSQPRFVPLGYSRKFWYDDALSEPVASATSPDVEKCLRLDPNILPLLQRCRVIIIDDAISSGATAGAAMRLLQRVGVQCVGMTVAMKQTNRWVANIDTTLLSEKAIKGVFGCPLFRRGDGGWWPVSGTQPIVP